MLCYDICMGQLLLLIFSAIVWCEKACWTMENVTESYWDWRGRKPGFVLYGRVGMLSKLAFSYHHLTLPEAADLAQNRPLWRMMSMYGTTQSWVACQKRWHSNAAWWNLLFVTRVCQLWVTVLKKDQQSLCFKRCYGTMTCHFHETPLPPHGHIWDVMLVWRKGYVEKTVSVLQYCVLL